MNEHEPNSELLEDVKADLCEYLDDDECYEAAVNIEGGVWDFELGGYRFIHEDVIDDELIDLLSSDEYALGCFSATFLSDVMEVSAEMIEAAQQTDPETVGKSLVENNQVGEVAAGAVSLDGYGHLFASYDGHEHTYESPSDGMYYYFKV